MTGQYGQGLYQFSSCNKLVHDMRVVEPDIERDCQDFEEVKNDGANVV